MRGKAVETMNKMLRGKITLPFQQNQFLMMFCCFSDGEQFDVIFIDADKENYIQYYDLAMDGLLAPNGFILADNSMCALLYDETDERSVKLHEFNQYVKNDKRVEQVILTIREGITMIKRV